MLFFSKVILLFSNMTESQFKILNSSRQNDIFKLLIFVSSINILLNNISHVFLSVPGDSA